MEQVPSRSTEDYSTAPSTHNRLSVVEWFFISFVIINREQVLPT